MLKQINIAVIATVLVSVSAHAKPGKGNRGGNGSSAEISYHIDPHSCAVTARSTKSISNIVIKDAHGNTIKKWDNLSGKSFSEFGMYAAYLPEGTLHVKSGNNGVRGLGPDIEEYDAGANFRHDLTDCLEPSCPFTIPTSTFLATTSTDSYPTQTFFDEPLYCVRVVDRDGQYPIHSWVILNCTGNYDCPDRYVPDAYDNFEGLLVATDEVIEQPDGRFGICYDTGEPGAGWFCPNGTDGNMSSEEALACAVEMGCENYGTTE